MASPRALARLQKLIWILIYGGLLAAVLGLATEREDDALGWSLVVAGSVVAAAGFTLIWVRSRLREDA
ncbi:hypothetical protein [Variovorax terrae]|uniref:Uncharacterized protein n=1 Tax=Variovorax terrae TaxID=2923278 RepID=A0A9X1VSV9_9BURK|nr:hypothetical protein [Variovorax terrae]MCJ0763276.1 hypothetical protein [Variovorax terrae]